MEEKRQIDPFASASQLFYHSGKMQNTVVYSHLRVLPYSHLHSYDFDGTENRFISAAGSVNERGLPVMVCQDHGEGHAPHSWRLKLAPPLWSRE